MVAFQSAAEGVDVSRVGGDDGVWVGVGSVAVSGVGRDAGGWVGVDVPCGVAAF